jgi:hypothetical protein
MCIWLVFIQFYDLEGVKSLYKWNSKSNADKANEFYHDEKDVEYSHTFEHIAVAWKTGQSSHTLSILVLW